jgi:SAM-dependent methyltransferase
MPWWYAVVESLHDIQNPISPEKILLLGERLGLGPSSRVLDIASGKGAPASLLAEEYGCRVTSVERSPEFAAVARERATELIEVIEADASTFEYEPGAYDAALCLGATFVYGGLVQTLRALAPAVRTRGFVAVGEPYWRSWPLPAEFERNEDGEEDEDFVPLRETVARAESTGVEVVSLIDSSLDDWDQYETLHWLALDEWLAANPDDPQADEFRAQGRRYRDRYLRWERDLLGWAIFVCRT